MSEENKAIVAVFDVAEQYFAYNPKGSKFVEDGRYIISTSGVSYDYIFLDCPPNITLVSENIFYASDLILVPVIPTTLSYRTFEKLLVFFKKNKMSIKKIVPFFSMVEIRKNMHKESIEALKKEFPFFLKSRIPYSSVVEKMGTHREPLGSFSPRSVPAQQYQALWGEVKKLIKKK